MGSLRLEIRSGQLEVQHNGCATLLPSTNQGTTVVEKNAAPPRAMWAASGSPGLKGAFSFKVSCFEEIPRAAFKHVRTRAVWASSGSSGLTTGAASCRSCMWPRPLPLTNDQGSTYAGKGRCVHPRHVGFVGVLRLEERRRQLHVAAPLRQQVRQRFHMSGFEF